MAYILQAILSTKHSLQEWCSQYEHATLISLPQNIQLVPIVDNLYDEINCHHKSANVKGFLFLNERMKALLTKLSESASLAYVEAEYFGGTGEQNAMLWKDGEMVYSAQGVNHAINHTLNQFGVIKEENQDEFDTVGLGRHRNTIDWVKKLD